MARAALSLGSNLGCRKQNIHMAVEALKNIPKTEIIKISGLYETIPWGVPDVQPNYINCCVILETGLSSGELLGVCLGIESALKRERKYKFSPRTIDIDLLIYGNETKNEDNLILPHPRLKQRAFVMIPLSEICENMKFGNVDFKCDLALCDCRGVKRA